MKTIVTFIGAVILGASAAQAQSVTVTAPGPVARVSFADLNLDSRSGKAKLQRRIRSAAGELCLEDGILPLQVRLQRHACFYAVVADGNHQLDELLAARASGSAIAATALTIAAH